MPLKHRLGIFFDELVELIISKLLAVPTNVNNFCVKLGRSFLY